MARPKPTVILKWEDPDGYGGIEICESDGLAYFGVLYRGQPVHLRHFLNTEVVAPGNIKYPKTVFANSAHAFNLADKLNRIFQTTDFTVCRMTNGYEIERTTDRYKRKDE